MPGAFLDLGIFETGTELIDVLVFMLSVLGSTGQPYLRGQTRFGDSIDDEWVVVHLLREITKRIPGSIAR